MTVWFTSDLHLGHRKVADIRGFDSPEAHDSALVANWSANASAKDDVWVLGDLAASSPTYALSMLATLPGRKHLIAGNHDRCHPMHRDSHNRQREYLTVFDSVQTGARRRINGINVLLSHFPYHRDREEPRYTQWRLRNEGEWLLHGHTHGRERLTVTPDPLWGNLMPPTREIHVGVDAWGMRPVALEEVAALMQEGA